MYYIIKEVYGQFGFGKCKIKQNEMYVYLWWDFLITLACRSREN